MRKKNILVLGYFGYETNQLDGQTVKTRNIYEMLNNRKSLFKAVSYYDTQHFRKNPFSILSLLYFLIRCNTLIILPAHNSLKMIFPITYVLSKLFKFEIIQITIGGWQEMFYKAHPFICKISKKIKTIMLENDTVKYELSSHFEFENLSLIPNFRINNYVPSIRKQNSGNLKIVFMSRVNKMKGLDIIFDIAESIKNSKMNVSIDFYGPINSDDESYFCDHLTKYDFVKHLGVLEPEKINKTLNDYDLLILPTKYYTEGFPGAVLDAYISGIPVLVSNWKHSHEFVSNGYNGFICDVNNTMEFIEVINKLYFDNNLLYTMKNNAYLSSKQYNEDTAWNILNKYL